MTATTLGSEYTGLVGAGIIPKPRAKKMVGTGTIIQDKTHRVVMTTKKAGATEKEMEDSEQRTRFLSIARASPSGPSVGGIPGECPVRLRSRSNAGIGPNDSHRGVCCPT